MFCVFLSGIINTHITIGAYDLMFSLPMRCHVSERHIVADCTTDWMPSHLSPCVSLLDCPPKDPKRLRTSEGIR